MAAKSDSELATDSGRFSGDGQVSIRSRAARGTIVNAIFMIAASVVTLVQALVVARLVSTTVYGEWGMLMAGFMSLLLLGSVGINDKYIQQDEADQQRAFEVAFTLQVALGAIFVVVVAVGMPLFVLAYGREQLLAPGVALALVIPAMVFHVPLWAHVRRMDFLRARLLQIIDPIVTFVATVALALAGLGIWALVAGAMIGTWTAALAMIGRPPTACGCAGSAARCASTDASRYPFSSPR